MIRTWLTNRARRRDITARFEMITGVKPRRAEARVLAEPEWGEAMISLLRMGIAMDHLPETLLYARHVAERIKCSPGYAAEWVATVTNVTGQSGACALMLANWIKPEWVPAEVND